MFDFSGRVLLVTGACGGIGAAIARTFFDAGASVLLADIREAATRAEAETIDPSGGRVASMRYDATCPEAAQAAVDVARERFGRLDYVVPAAAIYEDQPFESMTDDQWRRTMSVNVDGVYYICRRAVPVMEDGGSIVLIASDAAHQGASPGHVHYSASKGAVLLLARSIARETAPRIRINAVSPGAIDTPMIKNLVDRSGTTLIDETPMGRLGDPEDVANCVAFLCSDAANFITGAVFHVNGGAYLGN